MDSLKVAAVLTPEKGAVFAAVGILGLVHQWMAVTVALSRKKYNVPYPALYAEGTSEKAIKFNSIQRGHQNMLEALPIFLISQLLISTVYPYTAASVILFWTLGRIVYFIGYSRNGPSGRTPGALWTIGTQFATWCSLAFMGIKAYLMG